MDSESLNRIKYESAYCDMLIIADRLRHLISPLNAARQSIDSLLTDAGDEYKERLEDTRNAADRCLSAANDLLALTMPYFDFKNDR